MIQTASTQTQTPHTCGACGSRLSGRWEKLSPGLVRTLIKFYTAVCTKGKNEIHLQSEIELTKSEFSNFQKLRYFALVAKVKDKPGSWLITWQGRDFIRNHKRVARRVYIFQNKIKERCDELVGIGEVLNVTPYWMKKDDFLGHDIPPTTFIQEELF